MKRDRITELYEGTWGSAQGQRLARERIHWLCAQAVGTDILDVGCSQGIASILLAREGKRVVGIDAQAAAIHFAQERLLLEEELVQGRVRFQLAEAGALPFEPASFDTVLLGEVLEHLIDIEHPLQEARRVLRPSGRLVFTTPYGVSRSEDHKEPLYLRTLLKALDPNFAIHEIHLFEGAISSYLGIVAGPDRGAPEAVTSGAASMALEIAEQRLARQDQVVEDQRETIRDLRSEAKELRKQLRRTKADLARSERMLARQRQIVEERQQALNQRQAKRTNVPNQPGRTTGVLTRFCAAMSPRPLVTRLRTRLRVGR